MAWLHWLDYSSAERSAVLTILASQKENGTIDEFGIGTIRDAIADQLFPPLNTLQTRAKYFLFIPWISREIEAGSMQPEKLPTELASRERRLIKALLAGETDDVKGLIGRESNDALKRLPSSVYWSGLRRLGIYLGEGSLAEYLRGIGEIRARKRARQLEESDKISGGDGSSWDYGLPPADAGFLTESRLSLDRTQADYLREKTLAMTTQSGMPCLMQWLIDSPPPAEILESNRAFWDLLSDPKLGLPIRLQDDCRHAGHFSQAVKGLTALYYYLLARKRESRGKGSASAHLEALTSWCAEVGAMASSMQSWHQDFDLFQIWVKQANPRLNGDLAFVRCWLDVLASLHFRPSVETLITTELEVMLTKREHARKKALARLSFPGPLDRWNPDSRANHLGYRWSTARQFVADVHAGLAHEEV